MTCRCLCHERGYREWRLCLNCGHYEQDYRNEYVLIETRQDRAFIAVARAFGTLADCRHRNVGAVVVVQEPGIPSRIVGHGFNKGPDHKPNCTEGGCPRGLLPRGQGELDYSDCITVHAEVAAVTMAGTAFCEGSTLYASSEPCFMCYRIAEGAGIVRVVWQTDGEASMHERQLGKH